MVLKSFPHKISDGIYASLKATLILMHCIHIDVTGLLPFLLYLYPRIIEYIAVLHSYYNLSISMALSIRNCKRIHGSKTKPQIHK